MKKYHQTVDIEDHDELATTYESGTFLSMLTLVMLGGGKIFIYVVIALFIMFTFCETRE
tara:strand:- start:622 stop:798 length:177 start_codon:yes stop_codon:yes gene_type:complete